MNESSPRWREIAPSEYPWEREALAFVRARLPDGEPFRAWSNLEFVAEDGKFSEVDLLVAAPRGLFMVEIKSWDGRVAGDTNTWEVVKDGRKRQLDSPLMLTNVKARKLASRLRRQKALQGKPRFFVEALVFLSHPAVRCDLADTARQGVHLRDLEATAGSPGRPGIVAALSARPGAGESRRLDPSLSRAIAQALEQMGVRPMQRYLVAGNCVLDEVLDEGPGFQDWLAHQEGMERVRRRVRIYNVPLAAGTAARAELERAADRELQALEGLQHPGVLKPRHLSSSDRGPALIFDYDPEALRLDLFLREQGSALGFGDRLRLVRQLAEVLQFVHEKRLYHRALSPASIVVRRAEGGACELRIGNWQTALHETLSTGTPGRLTGVTDLGSLVGDPEQAYVAPEAVSLADAEPETLDVFSLGAVAFLILSGRPPAASQAELQRQLLGGRGLQLAGALDGAHPQLCELVDLATRAVVAERLASVTEFLEYLDVVEEELAKSAERPLLDPAEATSGDLLPGGFRVLRRLGRGSSAVVFLVHREGKDQVLKLALDASSEARLEAEAEVLRRLDHAAIVALLDTVRVGERLGLLLPFAEGGTLAGRLRQDGRLQPELLERFGEDLLGAVRYLEREGVPHRDIKPDNIGVTRRGGALHLVLLDFSLSRTPPSNLLAGTRPYLDPFLQLRRRPRWDLQAERFAAGVTLYEMAFGVVPQWGDGRSHPALVEDEVRVEAELLDSAVRDPLADFFRHALARRTEDRFDNAAEMLSAWRRAFASAGSSTTSHTAEAAAGELEARCAEARLETRVALLGLSTRAVNALERAQVETVRELLALPLFRLNRLRGVGSKTRKELLQAVRLLEGHLERPRLPESPAVAAEGGLEAGVLGLDLLLPKLLGDPRRKASSERRVVEALLGLEEAGPGEGEPELGAGWRSQSEVAKALELTRARISQVAIGVRARWGKQPAVTQLREDVAAILDEQGSAATAREVALALLARRGSSQEGPRRLRAALAALRAACEVEEGSAAPRWRTRRGSGRVLLALEEPAGANALLDYADALGRQADALAAQDPLPSPQRVLEELQQVPLPPGLPVMAPERLLRLAAAASEQAALSSRLELYPRGLAADRALRLASGSLLGAQELSLADVRSRVSSRFPDSRPLPGPPELDAWLREVGLNLEWQPEARQGQGAYVFPEHLLPGLSSSTVQRTTLAPEGAAASPETLAAEELDERLARAAKNGSFLVLMAEPRDLVAAERRLARFPVQTRSLEALWLAAMRRLAAHHGVDWQQVLAADALPPQAPDAITLRQFAHQALAEVEAGLAASPRTLLLTRPGLLARYGEVGLLERLRERVLRKPAPGEAGLHGVWVLTAAEPTATGPQVDGVAIPVPPPARWTRIPKPWLSLPPPLLPSPLAPAEPPR